MSQLRHTVHRAGLLLALMMLFATIVLAEVKQAYKTCQAIDIQIHSNGAQQFIDTKLLYQQLTTSHQPPVLGQPLRTLTTKPIENTIKSDNFVHKSIVYKSWQGVLNIAIWPRKPIARILYTHQPSQYIDEEGQLLPLSDRYTARVPLIEADHLPGVQNDLHESPYGRALLALLRHIAQDKFWRAQIAHLCIDAQGKIVFHTQISKQRVEFGPPQDVASKLAKLQLFYQKIVPHKGWNAYKRVNLEFANQIVCE